MPIQVKHERPDQRRHHRVTAPLFVRVNDGPQVRARDWSLGGVRIDGYTEKLPALGEQLTLDVILPFQGFDIAFEAKAHVVRVVEEIRSFAVEFDELSERARLLMMHFIEDLVRGVMSPVGDAIQRIDLPVTPVSAEPDPQPKNVTAERGFSIRQATWVSLYAILGFVVFGYTALVLYSNVFRMEVQTAVVAAPIVKVAAQGDGELPVIRARVGDRVTSGETVVYFSEFELEKQIDLAKLKIQEKEAELNRLLARRAAELETMTEYAAVDLKNVEQTKIDVSQLSAEERVARNKYNRVAGLVKQGFATKSAVEEAENWLAAARAKLESKKLELKEQMRLADAGLGKRFYNGREMKGVMGEIDANIGMARNDIALSHQAHEALLKHRERLAVHAPFDGRVAELPVPQSASVKRGDIIAVFEKDSERWISAFLTQDEVTKVGLGDPASVFFPALDRSFRYKVTSIDRTSGFKDEVSRRFSWRGADDRSAEVKLELVEDVPDDLKAKITSGLPAIVLFEAKATNPILAAMWRQIASLFL
jgi:multidrug resistance efflux pump